MCWILRIEKIATISNPTRQRGARPTNPTRQRGEASLRLEFKERPHVALTANAIVETLPLADASGWLAAPPC